jgi:hypothetical protein
MPSEIHKIRHCVASKLDVWLRWRIFFIHVEGFELDSEELLTTGKL